MALGNPAPFADPYSSLSRGIESGVGIGLRMRAQGQAEDAQEFAKLQQDLETKRKQKALAIATAEKQYNYHALRIGRMKTPEDKQQATEMATKFLAELDKVGGTKYSAHIRPEQHLSFVQDMEHITNKVAPENQPKAAESLLSDVYTEKSEVFPIFGKAGLQLPTVEKPVSAAPTIRTDAGLMQWNPPTERYDIKAGNAPLKTGGPGGGNWKDKKSKAVFDYMETSLKTTNEYGMVKDYDAETGGKATMLIDEIIEEHSDWTPQRIGEEAIRRVKAMALKEEERARKAEKPPAEGAEKAPDGLWYVKKGTRYYRVD